MGTFHAMKHREFDCSACQSARPDIKDPEVRATLLERIKTQKGCRGGFSSGYTMDRVVKLTTCPGNLFNFEAAGTVDVWVRYRNGVPPYATGSLEWPAKLVEAFGLLDRLETETKKR